MKALLTAVLLLTIAAAPALAQVAAPPLTPGGAPTAGVGSVPPNPAVMAWDDRSHLALGALETAGSDLNLGTLVSTDTELDGKSVALRLASSIGVLAAEGLDAQGTVQSGATDMTIEGRAVGLGIPLGDAVSLGVSQRKYDVTLENAAARLSVERSETVAGATLRLGGWFYLGAAVGTEEVGQSFQILPAPPTEVSLERDVRYAGIGIRTEGNTQWHLEYLRTERDDAETAGPPATTVKREEEDTVVAEVLVAQAWLLGVARTSGTDEFPGSALGPMDKESTRVIVGYAPRPGWALFAVRSTSREEDSANRREDHATAVTLAYQF